MTEMFGIQTGLKVLLYIGWGLASDQQHTVYHGSGECAMVLDVHAYFPSGKCIVIG